MLADHHELLCPAARCPFANELAALLLGHNTDILETRRTQCSRIANGAAPATQYESNCRFLLDLLRQRRGRNHIRNRQPSTGFQHTESVGEYLWLVRGEVDDAIRHDHIRRVVERRQVFDLAKSEFHIRITAADRIRPCLAYHLRRHVHANDAATVTHLTRSQKTIEMPPLPQIAPPRPASAQLSPVGCRNSPMFAPSGTGLHILLRIAGKPAEIALTTSDGPPLQQLVARSRPAGDIATCR